MSASWFFVQVEMFPFAAESRWKKSKHGRCCWVKYVLFHNLSRHLRYNKEFWLRADPLVESVLAERHLTDTLLSTLLSSVRTRAVWLVSHVKNLQLKQVLPQNYFCKGEIQSLTDPTSQLGIAELWSDDRQQGAGLSKWWKRDDWWLCNRCCLPASIWFFFISFKKKYFNCGANQ